MSRHSLRRPGCRFAVFHGSRDAGQGEGRHPRSGWHAHLRATSGFRRGWSTSCLPCATRLPRFSTTQSIGPDLSDLLKRLYLDPARKKAAALYQAQNAEFKEKQIHQKVEITKIDILDSEKSSDGAGKSYEAVTVRAEGNLIRTGTVNKLEFREPVKFAVEFLFIRNPDLLANGRLPLVVQDFKYKESPL